MASTAESPSTTAKSAVAAAGQPPRDETFPVPPAEQNVGATSLAVAAADTRLASSSSSDYRVTDPQRVQWAEVTALDASAAANAAEAEASLRRTTQEAHRALQTAHVVTHRLSTQGEKLSAVAEAQRENEAEWRRGRREMRRTRHWYAALAHWFRCGGSASFRGVATKGEGKALPRSPDAPVALTKLNRVYAVPGEMQTTADEPLRRGSCSSQFSSREASVAGEQAGRMPQPGEKGAARGPPAARASRLRDALEKNSHVKDNEKHSRADVELSVRLEPQVAEVSQLVKEMRVQALLHNEMLTAHNEQLDEMNGRAEKTFAKNAPVVHRR